MSGGSQSMLLPKQRVLTESETPSTFTTWSESIIFHIVIDNKLARYNDPADLGKWQSSAVENRGYTNDDGDVAENIRMTAVQKQTYLKVLLGSISTFAPVISNKFITDQATSINEIFEKLRGHYGFRSTGGRMLELAQFTLGANESYETLWERMSGFVDDNLLKQGSEILHLSNKNTTNELPSPMVQNMLVVLWLKTINPALPTMIKQRFRIVNIQ